MEKVEVDLSLAYRLLYPRHVVLVSCVDKAGKANIITLALSMPTSIRPPMVAISIGPKRYSHQIILETKEFVVNIPTMDIIEQILLCGRISGVACDKFKEAKLTAFPARMVKPSIIKECIAHLECKLHQQATTGDHTLFIGHVLAAYANKGIFDKRLELKKAKLVYHVGGDNFVTIVPEVVKPRLQMPKGQN